MNTQTQPQSPIPSKHGLLLLTVAGFADDGSCLVHLDPDDPKKQLQCDLMYPVVSGQSPISIATDDTVIVWLPKPNAERGVLMGRVGPSHDLSADSPPTKLMLAAEEELMLRCGDSIIIMRGDGKIITQGKNILSEAEQTNRVSGGSVALN